MKAYQEEYRWESLLESGLSWTCLNETRAFIQGLLCTEDNGKQDKQFLPSRNMHAGGGCGDQSNRRQMNSAALPGAMKGTRKRPEEEDLRWSWGSVWLLEMISED